MRFGSRSPDRGGRPAAADLLDALRERHATLATAESLTGGRLAALVTEVPGASAVYVGGVVSYATELKVSVLGVPEELVQRYGVVSPECAGAMARGVRGLTGATYALSTTGVAGPDEQEGKAVGTVYVGVAGPDGETALALELVGDRQAIQDRTCREALDALLSTVLANLRGEEPGLG
ncbi:MAG: CinA family protein [Nocardioides sp.]